MGNSGSTALPQPVHRLAPARLSSEAQEQVFAVSGLAPEAACRHLSSELAGLTREEAESRLETCGPNLVARESKPSIPQEIWARCRNPLNALLLALAAVSYFLGDVRAAIVIALMVLLAIATAFVQEHRSNEAAARLRAMVKTTASVRRRTVAGGGDFAEVPLETLVPGDVVRLSAGDMIPADLRLLEAKDLFINQSALTGEAMPAEKFAHACDATLRRPLRSAQHVLHGRQRRQRLRHRRGRADGRATPSSGSLPTRSPAGACRPRSIKASTGSPG